MGAGMEKDKGEAYQSIPDSWKEKMTEHFTTRELTRSEYAIRHGLGNIPSLESLTSLHALCVHTLEPIRSLLAVPLVITSGYRSRAVNRGIGGSPNSQHIFGEAADFEVPAMSHMAVVRQIAGSKIPFDQLIYEYGESGWVHVSFTVRHPLRHEVLMAYKDGKQTKYEVLER